MGDGPGAGLLRTNLFVVCEFDAMPTTVLLHNDKSCRSRLPAVERQAIYWRLACPFHLLPFDLSLAKRSRFISGIVCSVLPDLFLRNDAFQASNGF